MAPKTIFVAGHKGMVGSALVRKLEREPDVELILRSSDQLDLCNQMEVSRFFHENRIDEVYLAAAKVGGIHANNTYPAEFIYKNSMIECNVIHAAHQSDVNKLLFLGSSCIYPRLAEQPINEESLLSGYLEPTNEPYAVAKILGIKLCESYNRQYQRDYRSVMPTNLYGPNDNFHPENSHVIPALIRRFYEAKRDHLDQVTIWGTGRPKREFLHVDDMANASIFVMNIDTKVFSVSTTSMCSHVNVGTGIDCTIKELVQEIALTARFNGVISFDSTKPDGVPRKLLDTSLINSLGWSAKTDLKTGLAETYDWYAENQQVSTIQA